MATCKIKAVVAVNKRFHTPSLLMQSKERRIMVLELGRHVKKKNRQKPPIKEGDLFPSNKYPLQTMPAYPLPLWLVQQPALQAHLKA